MKRIMCFLISIMTIVFMACSDNDNDDGVIVDGDVALINVTVGRLGDMLKDHDLSGIKSVTIKGKMNLYDFKALSEVNKLEFLDISNVVLVSGHFEENSCVFVSKGEENYLLWRWVFRCLGDDIVIRYPNLKSVVLPVHNKVADSEALAHYSKLEKVVLSQDLSSLGAMVFYECPLKYVYSKSVNPPHVGSNAFYQLSDDCVLYVPKGSKIVYQEAEGWRDFKRIEEE